MASITFDDKGGICTAFIETECSDVVINSGGSSSIVSRDGHITAADVTVTKTATFPDKYTTQYVRLKAIGDNNDADDLTVVDAWLTYQK